MSLFADIRAALSRPLVSPPLAQEAAPPARKRAPQESAPRPLPLTEAEFMGLLQETFTRRLEVEAVIAGAAAAREAALEADDCDAVLAVDAAVRRAEWELRKLGQDEPKLVARMREARIARECADFIPLRDTLVAAANAAMPALTAAAEANEKWQQALDRALSLYPDMRAIAPGVVTISRSDVAAFQADVSRLNTTIRTHGAQRRAKTVAEMIARAKETGVKPGFDNLGGFDEHVTAALQEQHKVVTLVSMHDNNRRPVHAGAELTLDFDAACKLVQTGQARWIEAEKPKAPGQKGKIA